MIRQFKRTCELRGEALDRVHDHLIEFVTREW
jgi:hypothetical protein